MLTRRTALLGLAGGAAAVAGRAALAPSAQAQEKAPFGCEPRYVGYREADLAKPYARFFTPRTSPLPARVRAALAAGPVAPEAAVPWAQLADEMARPGYSTVETGYTTTSDGKVWISCLTDMPGVRPEMWDWWFGWHSTESARYKLWHPQAHTVAVLREDRSADRSLSDKERYVGNTSYVDEYIGPHLQQLAIRFDDPKAAGFGKEALAGTLVYGRVGSSTFPVDLGWLCHQVRPTATGSEMRSRFLLNALGLGALNGTAAACGVVRGLAPIPPLPFDNAFAAELLEHCGAEMNHLAGFLPELYAAFRGTP